MRIAFVTYEYPPETALGGIATYAAQITRCLAAAGHSVEVFCGGDTDLPPARVSGVLVHRIRADRMSFAHAVVAVFLRRHAEDAFDVMEGPDFLAEALEISRALPSLPYVVRLHTPFSITLRLNRPPYRTPQFFADLRKIWSALRTRSLGPLRSEAGYLHGLEGGNLLRAHEISSPSRAISGLVQQEWSVPADRVSIVPFPYEPPGALLSLPIEPDGWRIGFLGRLEQRKGVYDLARAVPELARRFPKATFRFVGAPCPAQRPFADTREHLSALLSPLGDRVVFTGKVSPADVPRELAQMDICVFPSLWESFGLVVLEAMAAGRAVVCSSHGGMAEIVEQGRFGRLVPPRSPESIVETVGHLLENQEGRRELARVARAEGLSKYSPSAVLQDQLRSYERARSTAAARKSAAA